MTLSPDLLVLLRVLTLLARLTLAAALLYLVLSRGRLLSARARGAWAVVTGAFVTVALDNTALELLRLATHALEATDPLERFRLVFYNFTYLLHAVLGAAMPLALIALFLERQRLRAAVLLSLALVVATGGAGLLAGALQSWETLLAFTGGLAFAGIAGYLAFWAFLLLGGLPRVDPYLAGLLAVETVFELLLPIQDAFFQLVGRDAAASIWHLSQFLQLVTSAGQLVIVLAFLNVLVRGRSVRDVAVPV